MLLLILTGLAWMVQIMSMMKFLISYGVRLSSFLGLTVLMVPFILSIIVPFVTFIAILFVYNKMIGDNEVVVMAASGTSPGKIARPALILAGILTVINLVLNLWVVPATQAKFYDTQWNLRYGLAHLKLQEGAFTEMTHDLVVYVDKVSGYDLKHVMLSDTRKDKSQMIIFAENGKLVTTMRGLSIVMTNGSLQATGNGSIIGTFDGFDMDLSINEQHNPASVKTRSMSTSDLIGIVNQEDITPKQRKTIFTELCTRFLQPIMNFILAALCLAILLRSSLLRRRASFAPAFAVVSMSVVMAAFMSASNLLESTGDLFMLAGAQVLLLGFIMLILLRRK
ncbi:MAG: LptF/LptG family permease [Alphaproteobacteria bacterium]|nr:LptF/LptG family permease [Alphaproteobacteria bacterium]MBR4806409.1 LptF/LptG family permease [Alphaproteobacteria bacterium]